jgi:zinc protease
MKKLSLVFLLFISLVTGVQAANEVIRYQLDNGFTVILHPDKLKNEVFGVVVANVGAKNDPATATGLAHYMEHMLFKGTASIGTISWEAEKPYLDSIIALYDQLAATTNQLDRQNIQQKINEASLKANEYVINNELWSVLMGMGGTDLNAGTSPDATFYYNTFPPAQIEKWLEIYSHRFIDPVFRGFQAELEVVYEEKNMYADMFVFSILEEFQRNFFKNHPYGQQSTIGTLEHLKNPQLSKMIEFYNTWYVANNMALILVGNFDPEQVIPVINEKFSRLPYRELPSRLNVAEESFRGREQVNVKYSPVALGLLGFRTVPKLHPDKIKLDIANGILSNTSSSGLLDRLTLENKVMAAQIIDLPYNDHGASIILFVPKILRQSLSKAESLVLQQLQQLRNGQFDEELVEAIKLEKYRDFQLNYENYTQRGMLYADAFVTGEEIDEVLKYPELVRAVSKEDIIDIARLYYNDNFLAFHSKMGSPKKEKIEKPGFKPVITNFEANSEYIQQLNQMPRIQSEYNPVDFEKDVVSYPIRPLTQLFVSSNPLNDIFDLTIRYKTGKIAQPVLKHLAIALNYAGTEKYSPVQLKTELGKLGCTYAISCTDNFFVINLKGPEENHEKALKLINDLMVNAAFPKTAVSKIWDEEKMERKLEQSEPRSAASALLDYVRYGNKSGYLTRLSKGEIKKLDEKSLKNILTDLRKVEMEIHYSGEKAAADILATINAHFNVPAEQIAGNFPVHRPFQQHAQNTVFFLNDKKALQSNILFFIEGEPFTPDELASIDAFNTYFGGSFSGIVLQEIREFRSLSYAASGNYQTPVKNGWNSQYVGFVGTQADKTVEALEVYTDLLKNLPAKPERMEMIKNYLTFSGETTKPDFREVSFKIQEWKQKGFDQDPYSMLALQYQELDFEAIQRFHEKHLQNKPVIIVIVGDKKRLDLNGISRFGNIVEVTRKDIFNN